MSKIKKYLDLVPVVDGEELSDELLEAAIALMNDGDEVSWLEEFVDTEDTHPAGPGERGGAFGLVHEDGTPCNARTIESCPHEKRVEKSDRLEKDRISRNSILHDKGYLKAQNELGEVNRKIKKWRRANPDVSPLLCPFNKEKADAFAKVNAAREKEEREWDEQTAKGVRLERIWNDKKGRTIVSVWRHGQWKTCYDKMDPREVAQIRLEAAAYIRKHPAKVKASAEMNRIYSAAHRARKSGVAPKVYMMYRDEYLENTGRKNVDMKGFKEWLNERGIPLDGRRNDTEASRRYLGMAAGGEQEEPKKPAGKESMSELLAKFGIKPDGKVSSTPDAGAEPARAPADDPTSLARQIAAEMKKRYQ